MILLPFRRRRLAGAEHGSCFLQDIWASAATGLRGRAAAVAWFDGASDSGDDEDDSDAPPPSAPVVIDVDAPPPPTSRDRPIVIDDDAVPAATPSPPAAKELPWWAEPLPAPIFDTPAERRAARVFTASRTSSIVRPLSPQSTSA